VGYFLINIYNRAGTGMEIPICFLVVPGTASSSRNRVSDEKAIAIDTKRQIVLSRKKGRKKEAV
jgi:hypothetical protein